MAYSKIRQPKLSDAIEQQLATLIMEGSLCPGEQLPPERELARQFDVSRPSVREAFDVKVFEIFSWYFCKSKINHEDFENGF